MNYNKKYPWLSLLFSGHFYPYWQDDYKSENDVIENYLARGYKFERYQAIKEIDDLFNQNYTDNDLKDIIYKEFQSHCTIEKSTIKSFLIAFREQLVSSIDALRPNEELIEHLSSNLKKLESLRDNYTNKKELLEELNKIAFYKNDCEQGIRNPLKFVKNEIVDWKRILEQKTQEIEGISEYAKEIDAQRNKESSSKENHY